MKKLTGEKAFDLINHLGMVLLAISWIYPFIYILAISMNEAMDSALGGIYLFPRKFSLDSYKVIFQSNDLLRALFMSIARTSLGTVITLFCSSMLAYTLTRRDFIIIKPLKLLFFVAFFLGGGALIPNYMLYRGLHLINRFLVYIIPMMVNLWFVILFRTYFSQIPKELQEAADVDGANELLIFFRIMLPLSIPMTATVGLFAAVGQWNSWHDTLFFANKEALKTLQFRMMEIMLQQQSSRMMREAAEALGAIAVEQQTVDPESVRMAITIIATLPIVLVYPFLQKYFLKGMVVGSLKG